MKNHFRYHLAFLFVLCVTYSKTSICQESARQLDPQFIDFKELPFEMSPVVPPTFPDKTFDIRQYGAREGGSFKNTLAIASAIEACYNAGGGKVLIPEGVWLTGPIHFKSNINLHIAEGAEVRFSQDQADYLPVVFTRWEGIECYNYSPLIYARDCENIALTGKGIFDGQGDYWWAWEQGVFTPRQQALYDSEYNKIPVKDRIYGTREAELRPPMLQIINCRKVLLADYTCKNAPFWTNHIVYCDGVIVRDIVLINPPDAPNTDGLNFDSSKNIHVQGVFVSVGDDAVCLKSGMNEDGWRVGKPSENIVIENCYIEEAHGGIVFGSDLSGGIKNVFVSNCSYNGTLMGIRLKSMRGRGAKVENIWIQNIKMKNVSRAIHMTNFYNIGSETRSVIPTIFRNINIKNITAHGVDNSINIIGLPEQPIENLRFENITINSVYGMEASNCSQMILNNVKIFSENSPVMNLIDCKEIKIKNSGVFMSNANF